MVADLVLQEPSIIRRTPDHKDFLIFSCCLSLPLFLSLTLRSLMVYQRILPLISTAFPPFNPHNLIIQEMSDFQGCSYSECLQPGGEYLMFLSSCAMKTPYPEEGRKGHTGGVNVIYTCVPVTKCNI